MPTTLIIHVSDCEACPFYLRRGHERRWCMHPAWERVERPATDTVVRDGGARLRVRHLPIPTWCPLEGERVIVQRLEPPPDVP